MSETEVRLSTPERELIDAGTIKMGDVFSIEGVYRKTWWKSLLIWLRLREPYKAKEVRTFVVTWAGGGR